MLKNDAPYREFASPSGRVTIPQLDSIRVFAMLGVFLHHLWKTVIVTPQDTLQFVLDPIFVSATGSVVIFNIISGFLLARPHLGPDHRPFEGYRVFLQKRFLRIIPPYYLALVLFTLVNMVHFGFPLLPAFTMLTEHLLFVNSLDYSNMFSNFSHFWYLGLLAQFYLLFPLILRFFIWMRPARAALTIIAVCWGAWGIVGWFCPESQQSNPGMWGNLMHFNLPGRLPEFATGMWLASLWDPSVESVRRRIFTRPFSVYIGALALFLVAGTPFVSSMVLPYVHIYFVALSVFLFLLLFLWKQTARAGQSTFIKHCSTQTYMIYIVHHPVFSYVGVMPSNVTHTVPNFLFLGAILLPLTYAVAVVLNRLSDWIVNRVSVHLKQGIPGKENA
jgi:peptidoglycan/LPS O-acetylase OafA/YrhL